MLTLPTNSSQTTVGAKRVFLQLLQKTNFSKSMEKWRNCKNNNQNKVINKTIKSHFKQNNFRNKNLNVHY